MERVLILPVRRSYDAFNLLRNQLDALVDETRKPSEVDLLSNQDWVHAAEGNANLTSRYSLDASSETP